MGTLRTSAAAMCLALTASAHAVVLVHFQPADVQVLPGSSFSVQLLADISQPVVGWGLDVSFDPGLLTSDAPAIGPAWLAGTAPDGDGLLGVAFPTSVSGNSVLLATLHFTALARGQSQLTAMITPGDLNEGFALDPVGFDTFSVQPASITVVPEAASMTVGLVLAALILRGRRRGHPKER